MTGFPRSPKLTRAGLVLIAPGSGAAETPLVLFVCSANETGVIAGSAGTGTPAITRATVGALSR
jgi:hypothetical protein